MGKITFLPNQTAVPFVIGQTLLEAALRDQVPLDHACGGHGACSTCHVVVEQGMECLSQATDQEQDRLDQAEGLTLKSRLACQARVSRDGEVVVRIPRVKGLQ